MGANPWPLNILGLWIDSMAFFIGQKGEEIMNEHSRFNKGGKA